MSCSGARARLCSMGWSFKLHGGIAAGLSALLLVLAALTWLPGTLPLVDSAWLTVTVVLLLFPVCAAAMLRILLTRADRHSVWLAFRCLPGTVQGALGSLVVSGVVVLLVSMAGAGNLQSAETRDGLPYFGATPQHGKRAIFAMAYGGNGMVYSALGAELVRAAVEGRTHPLAELFGFGRKALRT